MTETVFKATFSDFKNVKTRKVLQLIFEVPAEAADAALDVLGGVPRADKETWVGIARIDPTKATSDPPKPSGEHKERRRFKELPLAQQAAMRCGEKAFQRFITERYDGLDDEDSTVEAVREICGVASRKDIKAGTPAGLNWLKLNDEFLAWMSVDA